MGFFKTTHAKDYKYTSLKRYLNKKEYIDKPIVLLFVVVVCPLVGLVVPAVVGVCPVVTPSVVLVVLVVDAKTRLVNTETIENI